MTYSYTMTETRTFTVTHARHIAAKVATDLKRLQRFYGCPDDNAIKAYEEEAIALLKAGYLETVTYGFLKNGKYIEPTLRYRAKDLFLESIRDDDPGLIRPRAEIVGASFYSYLTYSSAWDDLTEAEKNFFKQNIPIQRVGAPQPEMNGYLRDDRIYSSGGRALYRQSLRSF